MVNYLKDAELLKKIDKDKLKTYFVKINVMTADEQIVNTIVGRVQNGSSINIDASSSMRRTSQISFLAENTDDDLESIESWFAINTKIQLIEGIQSNGEIYWFPLGIFVVTDPSFSHTNGSISVNLNLKDKMCLLNGECAGNLPTSVTFSEYDQIIGHQICEKDPRKSNELDLNDYTIYEYNKQYFSWSKRGGWVKAKADTIGSIVTRKHLIYDIIKTAVMFYGGESGSRIFIDDVPLEIKQSVRYVGNGTLFYNQVTSRYTNNTKLVNSKDWKAFQYNEDCGYVYTDFVYPGELITGIGDNICSVLDKIVQTLGNYEYFYDVEGNFHFQQIKNYLNISYLPDLSKIKLISPVQLGISENENDVSNIINKLNKESINENLVKVNNYIFKKDGQTWVQINDLSVLNNDNIQYASFAKSVYTFDDDSGLIASFSNSPRYSNIKNDFHVWGKNDNGFAIHYHVVIKDKPKEFHEYRVINLEDGKIRIAKDNEKGSYIYKPTIWQEELYLQGLALQAISAQDSQKSLPDIYQQELLDLMDTIYNFQERTWKQDISKPNSLKYWIDYLEPQGNLHKFSVDAIGSKIYSYQKDKIHRIFDSDIPDVIMIGTNIDQENRLQIVKKCEESGQRYSNVDPVTISSTAIGTWGYTAHETARELLYQYTDYMSNINITSIPIYYLDVNSRITVMDKASKIYGDYIIKNISLPLNASNPMSINAAKALERV